MDRRMSSFYKDGLRFSCTRCSRCCRHDEGYVFLSADDVDRLASHFGVEEDTLVEEYCKEVDVGPFRRLSLKEQANHDCVFWQRGACSVYGARPVQCQTYPFWEGNLTSREQWESEASECPGVGIGRLHSAEEIEEAVAFRRNYPPVELPPK